MVKVNKGTIENLLNKPPWIFVILHACAFCLADKFESERGYISGCLPAKHTDANYFKFSLTLLRFSTPTRSTCTFKPVTQRSHICSFVLLKDTKDDIFIFLKCPPKVWSSSVRQILLINELHYATSSMSH